MCSTESIGSKDIFYEVSGGENTLNQLEPWYAAMILAEVAIEQS
ncbi:hypothetical protein PRVXH_000348 [Proteinivorax hydrogeniformans]|uniref:Uncharacterized protein n=1 Tax=Proteinivorax hydrogeniformans TaxID=1826727 RepID=A0AAU8HUI9_9FIRM